MGRQKSPKKSGRKLNKLSKLKLKTKSKRKTKKQRPQKQTKPIQKNRRGRPKKKNNEATKDNANKRKRGRPRKVISLECLPVINLKKESVKKLEEEILSGSIDSQNEISIGKNNSRKDMIEQILFKIPYVINPLIGTPQQVQKELDALAKKMQREPTNNGIFDKIHQYMHGYLINVVLKKFPFIKGLQSVDIYQETLIALRFKAIPNFKRNKGMSFLNFSKMCIRRHLITLLNTAHNRLRDKSFNTAFPIDSSPTRGDDDNGLNERNTYANIIADDALPVDKVIENNEAYLITKNTLLCSLSDFERTVLKEYLASSSYKEISKEISKKLRRGYNTKSIDNALLRIRKKALYLMKHCKIEDVPLFIKSL